MIFLIVSRKETIKALDNILRALIVLSPADESLIIESWDERTKLVHKNKNKITGGYMKRVFRIICIVIVCLSYMVFIGSLFYRLDEEAFNDEFIIISYVTTIASAVCFFIGFCFSFEKKKSINRDRKRPLGWLIALLISLLFVSILFFRDVIGLTLLTVFLNFGPFFDSTHDLVNEITGLNYKALAVATFVVISIMFLIALLLTVIIVYRIIKAYKRRKPKVKPIRVKKVRPKKSKEKLPELKSVD